MAKRNQTRDGRPFKGGLRETKETRDKSRGVRRTGVDAKDLGAGVRLSPEQRQQLYNASLYLRGLAPPPLT